MSQAGGLIFISCGQFTAEERKLGNDVCDLVSELTPHRPYFADRQASFEGVTQNILKSLDDAVALIAIMHDRGRVVFSGKPDKGELAGKRDRIRASVWIEQEIAIATYITQILARPMHVKAYFEKGVCLEGLREKIQLNAEPFETNAEVLTRLRIFLPSWKDIPTTIKTAGPPKLRFEFQRGDPSNYMFKFTNEEDAEIIVQEIVLMYEGIELTDPLRPNVGEAWKLLPQRATLIGKTAAHQRNPASVLADLFDPKQIEMHPRGAMDVSVACEFRGRTYQVRRKFPVRASRMMNIIEPMH